jgi:hypothetical protein
MSLQRHEIKSARQAAAVGGFDDTATPGSSDAHGHQESFLVGSFPLGNLNSSLANSGEASDTSLADTTIVVADRPTVLRGSHDWQRAAPRFKSPA